MSKTFFLLAILIALALPASAEMYKWVDEKGTVHFTDDISSIPEKYRGNIEERKTQTPKEIPDQGVKEKPALPPAQKSSEPQGFEVNLVRRHELWLSEVHLNNRIRSYFIVDTGASFTLINTQMAKELGLDINETTPFIPIYTASQLIFTPLVTLKSVRVGEAEVENVDALIHNLPSNAAGLLGNSFLNKFRVVLDSAQGKMTLFSSKGIASLDRPGGYGRDYWTGQFRFYNRNLTDLRQLKARYETKGASTELTRVNNAIRYFENQLSELERRASFAGVPRNWRE
jgi:clan AA aspartic protease (TIGR02281 family)